MFPTPNKTWFTSSTGRDLDRDRDRDEPSHIHVARPSRLLRRDTADSTLEPADAVLELSAAEAVQAA